MTRLEAFEVAVYPLVVASTSVKVTVTTMKVIPIASTSDTVKKSTRLAHTQI
jgi:hypothetical protein